MAEREPITIETYEGLLIGYKDIEFEDIVETDSRAHVAVVETRKTGRPEGQSPIAWIPTDIVLPPGSPIHLTEITTFKGKGSLTQTFISPVPSSVQ